MHSDDATREALANERDRGHDDAAAAEVDRDWIPPPQFHEDTRDDHERRTAAHEPSAQEPLQNDSSYPGGLLRESASLPPSHLPASWSSSAAPLSMAEFLQQSRFEQRAGTLDSSSGTQSQRSSISTQYPSRLAANSRSAGWSLSGPADSSRSHSSGQSTLSGGSSATRKFAFPSATRLDVHSQPASRATTAPSSPIAEEDDAKDTLKAMPDDEQTTSIEPAATIIEAYIPVAHTQQPHTEHGIGPSVAVGIFGGAIYGYTTAIIAGISTPMVNSTFFSGSSSGERATLQGLLTASILVGGLIGTLISMPLSNRFGRKIALIVCGCICVAASVGMGLVLNFAALVVLRTILGLSVGMSATVAPLYNAETVTPEQRGVVGAVFQLSIVSSILLAQVINFGFNPSNSPDLASWRWQLQFILGGVFGACLVVTAMLVPESRVWMKRRARKQKAAALREQQQRELGAARLSRGSEQETVHITTEQPASFAFPTPSYRKGWSGLMHWSNLQWLTLAVLLSAGNQLTGINAVIFYAPSIFISAGYADLALVLTIAVVGSWNLISVLLTMPLIHRFPRRTLMLVASGVMTAGFAVLAIATYFTPESRAIPSIVGILLVVLGFELGPGPLFFVMASEAFPPSILHAGLSLSNVLAWCFNILISFLFPLMSAELGSAATFGIFLLINMLIFVAFVSRLPRHAEHAVITAPSASPEVMRSHDDMTRAREEALAEETRRSRGAGSAEGQGASGRGRPARNLRVAVEMAASPPPIPVQSTNQPADDVPAAATRSPPYQAADAIPVEAFEHTSKTKPRKHPMQSPVYTSITTKHTTEM